MDILKNCPKRLAIFFLLLLCGMGGYGQNFSLQVTPTEATCATGGTLTFSVINATSGVPVNYAVYLMPDIANPVAQTSNNSVTGLAPGNYYVTATQETSGGTVTAVAQARVRDNTQLSFTIINTTPLCAGPNDGSFTIDVTSGVPATYEIFFGPTIRPQQASPEFYNLE